MRQKSGRLWKNDMEWIEEISECPVYYPSKQDLDDPFLFLHKIRVEASKYGICKIVSPVRGGVSADTVLKDFKFETTVQPLRLATWDAHDKITFFRRGRKYKLHEFESMANKASLRCRRRRRSPSLGAHPEYDFWHELGRPENTTLVEYGINLEGTAFSSHPADPLQATNWNLNRLSRLPNSSLRFLEAAIPGITDPMLYIGMLFSMFAWHVEDHYLFSINYHHSGAPKTWYGVPADSALQFEKVVLDRIYTRAILSEDSEHGASKLLAEKTTMFSPKVLLDNDVPVYKAVQKAGEFVVTFPKAYHAGFSHGFNCGEAVNFATADWFPFGEEARQRYALLHIHPIIPLEELVCKHAMASYHQSNRQTSDFSCFVRLVEFYDRALHRLTCLLQEPPRARARARPFLGGTVTCRICKRDCYLACIACEACYSYSICLHHVWDAQIEWMNCECGRKTSVVAREDMSEYMFAAQQLGQNSDSASSTGTYLAAEGRRKRGKSNKKNNEEVVMPQIHSKL